MRKRTRLAARATAVATGVGLAAALVGSTAAVAAGAPLARPAPTHVYVSEAAAAGPANFAINLNTRGRGELSRAVSIARGLGAASLASYPEIGTFFVQSASPTFAQDFAQAAARNGIRLDSVGPTRQAAVAGPEQVVQTTAQPQRQSLRAQALDENSQFAREEGLGSDLTPDPDTAKAWGIGAIGAVEAQDVDVPLAPVTVGVLDSGIDADHDDLKPQVDTADSVGCTSNGVADTARSAWLPTTSGHGTHVAGIIAASHNGRGVDGVAPSAKLASVKVVNDDGFIYPEYAVCGFVWAAHRHFDATNNSYYVDPWTYWVPSEASQRAGYEAVRRAVSFARASGVVNVAAAGNADTDLDDVTTDSDSPDDATPIADRDAHGGLDIPAQLPGVVTTSSVARGAADSSPLVRSGFSNYGATSIDVAAPGTAIYSTYPGNSYAILSGTSMASPHAAGVVALLKAIHPSATPDQTLALLRKQAAYSFDRLAAPTDGKEYRGAGLVNALAAVTRDQPRPCVEGIEYSRDGRHWQAFGGARLRGRIDVRVRVGAPYTSVRLSVGSLALAEATGDGSFSARPTTVIESVDLRSPDRPGALTATVTAQGRNADPRADDDVTASARATVGR